MAIIQIKDFCPAGEGGLSRGRDGCMGTGQGEVSAGNSEK